MPASRPSRYKDRYDKLLDDSLAIVQSRDFSAEELAQTAEDAFKRVPGAVMVPIERIEPNPDNPRQVMDETAMENLAASISERGLLQPLVVRRDGARPGHYVVIAGSRRLLAARLVHGDPDEAVRACAAHLPCIVKDLSDNDAFADALLENLARADLSRAETMDALLRLHTEYGWSGNKIAKRTGRSQGDVSELLGIAQDTELANLVRADKLKPSTATIIKRMPEDARAAAIAEVDAGRNLTAEEVKRRYQAATRPIPTTSTMPARPGAPPNAASVPSGDAGVSNSIPPVQAAVGVSNSIPPPAAIIPSAGESLYKGYDGRQVSNSIPLHPDTGIVDRSDVPGSQNTTIDIAEDEPATAVAAILDQIESVGTLAAMVDAGTPTGQAMLAAVRRDLTVTHDGLAAYVKRLG